MRFTRIDGQGALRLYEMSFVIDELTAEDLRDALEDRYGPPRLATLCRMLQRERSPSNGREQRPRRSSEVGPFRCPRPG